MKFPFRIIHPVPVSVPFLTGIVAGIVCFRQWDLTWWYLGIPALCLTGWRHLPSGMILLLAGILAGGSAQMWNRRDVPLELQMPPGKGMALSAEIRIADPGVSGLEDLPAPRLIRAEVRRISRNGGEESLFPEGVTVFLQTGSEESLPRLRSGNVFSGEGVLEYAAAEVLYTDPAGQIISIRNPDRQFQNYLRKHNAAGVLRLDTVQDLRYEPRWRDRLCEFRDFLAARLLDGVEDLRIRREMASLFLGCRTAVPAEERDQWVRSGTIHLFSVSGMHVGVIAGVLLWIMRMMPFRLRYAILPLILLGYVLISGSNVPAVRAWCMVAAWSWLRAALCWMPNVQVLLWTAAALLLGNPENLTDMGFLYSFIITGSLLLLAERCREAAWMRDPLPWMPESPEKGAVRRFLHWRNRILCAILACGIAFLSGSVITLGYQGMFPLISVAANLALLPVVALIFPLAVAKILMGGIFGGTFLAAVLEGCWRCLHFVTGCAAAIGSSGAVSTPAWWEIALFYGALLAMLLPRFRYPVRIGAAAVLTALVCCWHWVPEKTDPALMVCQGGRLEFPMIAWADPVNRIGIVVNASGSDAAREVAVFFRKRGIGRIAELHFTRPRAGAVAGLGTLLRQMPVNLALQPERDPYGWRFEERCREYGGIRWAESGGSLDCAPDGVESRCGIRGKWSVKWGEDGCRIVWNGSEFFRAAGAGNRLECTIYE